MDCPARRRCHGCAACWRSATRSLVRGSGEAQILQTICDRAVRRVPPAGPTLAHEGAQRKLQPGWRRGTTVSPRQMPPGTLALPLHDGSGEPLGAQPARPRIPFAGCRATGMVARGGGRPRTVPRRCCARARPSSACRPSPSRVASAVSASTGTAFERLLHYMTDALGHRRVAWHGCCPRRRSSLRAVMTLALSVNGAPQAQPRLPADGTPSAQLLTQRQYVVERDGRAHPCRTRAGANSAPRATWASSCVTPTASRWPDLRAVPRTAAPGWVHHLMLANSPRAPRSRDSAPAGRGAHPGYQVVAVDKAQDAIVVRDLAHRIPFWNQGA